LLPPSFNYFSVTDVPILGGQMRRARLQDVAALLRAVNACQISKLSESLK
jgi:hypothetical protein